MKTRPISKRNKALLDSIDDLVEARDRLERFAEKVFEAAFEGLDIDGAQIQEWGVECDLLEERPVNPDKNEWGADTLYFMRWK